MAGTRRAFRSRALAQSQNFKVRRQRVGERVGERVEGHHVRHALRRSCRCLLPFLGHTAQTARLNIWTAMRHAVAGRVISKPQVFV